MPSQLAKRPLEMKITLNALEHLGMNLYSTIPAVLSEIVANAWDADASQVSAWRRGDRSRVAPVQLDARWRGADFGGSG